MIKDAVAKGLRADLDKSALIYDKQTLGMKSFIQNARQNDPLKRPNCKQLYTLNLPVFLCFISVPVLPFSYFCLFYFIS